jgi:hypothetical protein
MRHMHFACRERWPFMGLCVLTLENEVEPIIHAFAASECNDAYKYACITIHILLY